MPKLGKCLLLFALLTASLGRGLFAQTGSTTVLSEEASDAQKFPLWARDLRRAEIIAFGAFPFTVLAATFAVEMISYANHDWNSLYLPWPLKPAGGIAMSRDDRILALEVAALGSVALAVVDFIIVHYKRTRAAAAARNLGDGTPIITRRPWPAPESSEPPESLESLNGEAEGAPPAAGEGG